MAARTRASISMAVAVCSLSMTVAAVCSIVRTSIKNLYQITLVTGWIAAVGWKNLRQIALFSR